MEEIRSVKIKKIKYNKIKKEVYASFFLFTLKFIKIFLLKYIYY